VFFKLSNLSGYLETIFKLQLVLVNFEVLS